MVEKEKEGEAEEEAHDAPLRFQDYPVTSAALFAITTA